MSESVIRGGRLHGVAAAVCLSCVMAYGQARPIDESKSVMTIHVYKAGVLSALGHDHEISAPVAGNVDVEGQRVELNIKAAALRVQDPKASEKDRNEIQTNMLGPEVLDTATHQEIRFRSTSVEGGGDRAWKVAGELTLHGETRPVTVEVRDHNGRYTGVCRLKYTDFGITPVKVAGGTVRVKDEVQIDFDIQLSR